MVVADEVNRRPMEAANMSQEGGIVVMPTVVSDPTKAGVVEVALRTDKGNLPRNVDTVARKATQRASVGRSTPIKRNLHPDLGEPNRKIDSDRTTLRALSELEMERARPL